MDKLSLLRYILIINGRTMADNKQFTYRRLALAASYVDAVAGVGAFGRVSGLFLAAPRRTGKSTFLRIDMVPEC